MGRVLRHLFSGHWVVRRAFPQATLDRIETAVRESERSHRGEVRFAVEGALDVIAVARGFTARQRALDVFSLLRVWDTDENTGVLIYVQLVDRRIEIVADRGIAALIAQPEWDAICRRMEEAFAARRFEGGALAGVADVTALLARHFPARGSNPDELPDKPIVL
jgi:uncharacterized membrane protein